MFVLKHNEKYLRFGSYSRAYPVDGPEMATLYQDALRAKKRQEERFWLPGEVSPCQGSEATIYQIDFVEIIETKYEEIVEKKQDE